MSAQILYHLLQEENEYSDLILWTQTAKTVYFLWNVFFPYCLGGK